MQTEFRTALGNLLLFLEGPATDDSYLTASMATCDGGVCDFWIVDCRVGSDPFDDGQAWTLQVDFPRSYLPHERKAEADFLDGMFSGLCLRKHRPEGQEDDEIPDALDNLGYKSELSATGEFRARFDWYAPVEARVLEVAS